MRSALMRNLLLGSMSFLALSACTATRFIPKDNALLKKNTVVIRDAKPANFLKSDLEYLIAQKPNPSFFGNRVGLWFHYFSAERQRYRLWRWVHQNSGEGPVYVDEGQATNTAFQLSRYCYNKGYFNNIVEPKPVLHKNRLATMVYEVTLNAPYTLDSISQTIADSNLLYYLNPAFEASLIKKGGLYDAYLLDAERDRITNLLRNNGYYDFTKEYILFEVDTNLRHRALNLTMLIRNPLSRNGKTAPFHKRYFIKDITIFPAYDPFSLAVNLSDTLSYERKNPETNLPSTLNFVYHEKMGIKAATFNPVIQIFEDEPFSINKLRQTYKGLTNLKIFRASNIIYDTFPLRGAPETVDSNFLNCKVFLQRSKANGYSVELEGTNSGGDLGIRGGLVFSNKNLFKGSEIFRLRFNGGVEAQQVRDLEVQGQSQPAFFNTFETGVDASIYFPRFLSPVRLRQFAREYLPKTNVSIGFSNQNRKYYNRTILKTSFGYDWMASANAQHLFSPINLSSVKVNPSDEFQQFLDKQTNRRFKDQYSNHLILSMMYSYIYNNQNVDKLRDFFYYRVNAESSGGIVSLFNNTSLVKNSDDFNTILGIRYAQYLRLDQDFRYYRLLSREHRLVYRAMLGVGFPYGNSEQMPFEKSYFAGGSNGMRGWQLRHLGPGSYSDSVDIERIGDIQIEMNLEYRFPVVSYLKGALFMDIGNIWTLHDQTYFHNGTFGINTFYKELAVDAGMGFRFDFSFFIFRLDAAIPLRDPAYPEKQRWRLNMLQMKQLVWNFGIGYPF